MSDSDVDRQVWGGRIPVAFSLALDEVTGTGEGQEKSDLFLLVPRVAYLTLCSEKLRQHFRRPIPATEDTETWFEYRGRPLAWNTPVGVLFDCFGANQPLPWVVTVHFKKYPDTLLRCTTVATVESYFLDRVKEANYLKHGKTKIEGLDSAEDRKQLWLGLAQDDFEQFARVGVKLMTNRESNWFRKIPFRVYVIRPGDDDKPPQVLQEPYDSTSMEGTANTLGDLMYYLFHPVEPVKVVVHGIEPPLSTPLQWLSEHGCHPDNFVHIIVHVAA
eukprot:m.117882 g.117882  ORF g.117882 m.117882 type:complete len:274 (+) comp16414_c1_seq3:750-1571(+)